MGAGKTTIGREVAALTQRPFVDTDEEIEKRHGPIAKIFDDRGEGGFRELEERVVAEAVASSELSVIALGGGAILSEQTRERLRSRTCGVFVDAPLDELWRRSRGSGRPLARDQTTFRRLFLEREALYVAVGERVRDAADVLLKALRVHLVGGSKDVSFRANAVVGDENVLALHPRDFGASVHAVPPGETAKRLDVVARLWDMLDLERSGILLAFGGGTTDRKSVV